MVQNFVRLLVQYNYAGNNNFRVKEQYQKVF
jgi:hypothetical protein